MDVRRQWLHRTKQLDIGPKPYMEVEKSMGIGTAIREERKLHGLTQGALASSLHVSPALVGHWENEVRTPDPQMLCRIRDGFDSVVFAFEAADYLTNGLVGCDVGDLQPGLAAAALFAKKETREFVDLMAQHPELVIRCLNQAPEDEVDRLRYETLDILRAGIKVLVEIERQRPKGLQGTLRGYERWCITGDVKSRSQREAARR